MATRLAWWLNLDASHELEQPRAYGRPTRLSPAVRSLTARMTTLLDPDDLLLDGGEPAGPRAERALAFCPTPSALANLQRLGFTLPPAPGPEVLRAVATRAFCAERLGQTLAGATYVRDLQTLTDHVARDPDCTWLLKRDFSFAGRERRLVTGGVLDMPTLGFARRSFARGQGLQVEPLLARTLDCARHGYLLVDGTLLSGPVMLQVCDERGVWQRSEPALPGTLTPDESAQLEAALRGAGAALHEAGYFGPFGVDAFRHRVASGSAFQPRCEVNTRFSMGYPRSLLERALQCA